MMQKADAPRLQYLKGHSKSKDYAAGQTKAGFI